MAEKMFGQEESREDEPACGESLCVRPHQLCVPLLFHSVRQWWEREPFLPSFLPSYFLPSFLPSAWLHLCIPLCSSHWIVRSVSQAGFAVAAVSVHVCLCTCMHSWLCDCLCLCMWARLCVCVRVWLFCWQSDILISPGWPTVRPASRLLGCYLPALLLWFLHFL